MSFITPIDPVTSLIEDLEDLIKWFPDGLTLKYDKEAQKFRCIYDLKHNRFTEANDPITAIDMTQEMRCIMCNSTNTIYNSVGGEQNNFAPFSCDWIECKECNHCETI